ncbi:MAG: LEA type 2 family protein [Candidatus Freyarchaeota archaeon]
MGKAAVAIAVVVAVIVIAGLGYYFYYGVKPPAEAVEPEVKSITHSWGAVTHGTTEIVTEAVVYNPNPFSIPIKRIVLDLYMNDVKIASGSSEGVSLAGGQNTTVTLKSFLDNGKIPEWFASHVARGEVTNVVLSGSIVFDLKVTEFAYPFEQALTLKTDLLAGLNTDQPQDIEVGPVTLTLKELRSSWGVVTPEKIEINHRAVIHNPQLVPIPVTRIDYEIYMNDVKVGEGTTHNPIVLRGRGDTTVLFTTALDNTMLDEWWVTHIKNNEKTKLQVKIYSTIEIAGVEYSFKLCEVEQDITTNILKG